MKQNKMTINHKKNPNVISKLVLTETALEKVFTIILTMPQIFTKYAFRKMLYNKTYNKIIFF